jgi:hypothetical protein
MVCKKLPNALKPTLTGRKRHFCSERCRKAYHERYKYRLKRALERTEWHSPAEIVEAARVCHGRDRSRGVFQNATPLPRVQNQFR